MLELSTTIGANLIAAVAGSGATALSFTIAKLWTRWRQTSAARALADDKVFEEALASTDLTALGIMLRDRFGTVSLQALLDDRVTQERVFKSLERLTEVVNQPIPTNVDEEPAETPLPPTAPSAVGEASGLPPVSSPRISTPKERRFIDLLDQEARSNLAEKIDRAADVANATLFTSEVWTALAGARRRLEVALLSHVEDRKQALTYRMFWNPRLRAAMGSFLSVANRAIHGEETSREDAEKAIHALRFIARELPRVINDELGQNAQPAG